VKITYIVNKFPKPSETFVVGQITDLIDRGNILDDGNPKDLVNTYNKLSNEREKQYLKHATK